VDIRGVYWFSSLLKQKIKAKKKKLLRHLQRRNFFLNFLFFFMLRSVCEAKKRKKN